MKKNCTIDDLNGLYDEAEQVDSSLFSDQRSNLLLISGEHYSNKRSKYWNRIRENKDIPSEQKLRLTKNHIQKIAKIYVNNIVTHAPSVKVLPHNDKEKKDQKAAEMNNDVWQDLRQKHKLRLKTIQDAEDFIGVGEVCRKIFWDPTAGEFLGEEPIYETDEDGNPVADSEGNPIQEGSRPTFTGGIVYEKVYGFNLLRSPQCQFMGDGHPWCVRKLVDIDELKVKIGDDKDKLKHLTEASKKTYDVFDNAGASAFGKTKNQVMLREWYFPRSAIYPKGYFYIATETGILWEGELPFGIWPLAFEGFDDIQTSPRKRSIIKQLRPNQLEINRAASKMAEHQITLGDDKMMIQSGSKVTAGAALSGVRTYTYSGTRPEIQPGRSGDQYLEYMKQNIAEMYEIANINEVQAEKMSGAVDPFALLFTSIRNRQKFSIYSEKFESYLSQVCEISLELAKAYYTDDMIVPAVGRGEIVNIPEFRNTEKLCYQIKLEPQTDDPETMMGRQLILNNIIQYVGPQLQKEDIGKILRQSMFGNWKEAFKDFTLKTDRADNMILALDRGEVLPPNKYDDAKYMVQRLVDRSSQSDFMYLDEGIKANYDTMIQHYETEGARQEKEIMAAQKGFIPSGGPRVKADLYVNSPNNPAKVEKATLPTEALVWLIDQLAKQGSSQEVLSQMNQAAVAEMAAQINPNAGPEVQAPQDSGQPYPQGALQ